MTLINNHLVRQSVAVIFILSLFCSNILCQNNFVAIPEAKASQYHIDFARNFFVTPEAEKAERFNLYSLLKNLESLRGKIAGSADNLLLALQLNDQIQISFIRHYSYLYLRYAINTEDEASDQEASALEAEITKRTAFLNQELIQITDQNLTAFFRQKPTLKNYSFAIDNIRRYRPFTLSLKEEELLNATAPLNGEWQYDLYEKLLSRNPPAAPPAKSTDSSANQADTERAKREAEFNNVYAGFAAQRDLYAFALMRIAAARTQIAKLHHFEDASSQFYFDRYWTKSEVGALLEQIAGHGDFYRHYRQIQADYVKRITGYQDINAWDLSLTSKNIQIPHFTIEQATQAIEKALAPLGSEYGRELSKLLDPENGRMDIVPGKNRRRGGFSRGFIGTDSVFFSGGFRGAYNDMRVLTHESTHAVQRQLMNNNKILPAYADGPHYLFEAFAILNEFILPDYLSEHETDPALKRYYLEQFLEGKGLEIFIVAPEAILEQEIYKGVANGTIKGADELDALTKQIYSRFSIFPGRHEQMKNEWMRVRLMFEDPFYDINYVYGALLALKLYSMFKQDPQSFAPRYIALLKNGFNAPPEVLLKRFLNIDMHDPQFLPDALKILEEKVNQLEKSYKE